MKRPLPVWIAAVVPATLAGHGLAYAIAGRTAGDPRHAWVAPALHCSLALLAALCCGLLVSALLKAGILTHTAIERSVFALWPRLALGQLVMFSVMERLEGTHAGLLGCAVQIAVALCAAYFLALFSRLLVRCIAGAQAASRYLQRLFADAARYVSPQIDCRVHALQACAGSALFKRPPPV